MHKRILRAAASAAVFVTGLAVAQPLSLPCPWDGATMLPTYRTQQGNGGLLYEYKCTLKPEHTTWHLQK